MAFDPLARIGRLFGGQQTHQRRFAGAVGSDQRDPVAALDVQAEIVEHGEVAVRLAGVLQLEDGAAALRARREVEVNGGALGRHVDRHHLFEHLDAALHLRGLGGLVAEPIDEHLDARHLFVLLAFGLAQRFDALVVLDQVAAVIGVVVGQRAQRQIGNAGDHGVEEEAVVRDENHRMRVAR